MKAKITVNIYLALFSKMCLIILISQNKANFLVQHFLKLLFTLTKYKKSYKTKCYWQKYIYKLVKKKKCFDKFCPENVKNLYFLILPIHSDKERKKGFNFFCVWSELGKTHIKKVFFLVVGPLRGGGVPPRPLSKKPLFFYKWRKFTGKLHNETIIL